MSVLVSPSGSGAPDANAQEYRAGTGANYDEQGFLVVVKGEGDAAEALAVWAPGQWQRAEIRQDRS